MGKINPWVLVGLGTVVAIASLFEKSMRIFVFVGLAMAFWGFVRYYLDAASGSKKDKSQSVKHNVEHQAAQRQYAQHQQHNQPQRGHYQQHPNAAHQHHAQHVHQVQYKKCPNCLGTYESTYRFCPYCGYGV